VKVVIFVNYPLELKKACRMP